MNISETKPNKMQWQQLLSLNRFGDTMPRARAEQDAMRNVFETDYDRIIFSHPFRSMQDKTQIIPHSQTAFVHTRLTHSLEVSVVGRSLGRLAGQYILLNHPHLADLGYIPNDFGAIVAAACLAHDIGNPPFGHSGEKAIGDYFLHGKGQIFQQALTPTQWHDVTHYEGNANGFHIINTYGNAHNGGLRLTYATLGAFLKYPKASFPHKPTNAISDKKFGFFKQDQAIFQEVAQRIGLLSRATDYVSYCRHPLAYLVEAADDICYTIIDFEDGINLGWINAETGIALLQQIAGNTLNTTNYNALQSIQEKVGYLRAICINKLITNLVEVFMQHEVDILSGQFPHALMTFSVYKDTIDNIIQLSIQHLYNAREVVEKELFGYKIIHTLLHHIITFLQHKKDNKITHFDELFSRILPQHLPQHQGDVYALLMDACHYVASLSDGKARELYHIIEGK